MRRKIFQDCPLPPALGGEKHHDKNYSLGEIKLKLEWFNKAQREWDQRQAEKEKKKLAEMEQKTRREERAAKAEQEQEPKEGLTKKLSRWGRIRMRSAQNMHSKVMEVMQTFDDSAADSSSDEEDEEEELLQVL